jgi:hypothetical protein
MDMHVKPHDQLIFHLTGKCLGEGLTSIAGLDARAPRCWRRTVT